MKIQITTNEEEWMAYKAKMRELGEEIPDNITQQEYVEMEFKRMVDNEITRNNVLKNYKDLLKDNQAVEETI